MKTRPSSVKERVGSVTAQKEVRQEGAVEGGGDMQGGKRTH